MPASLPPVKRTRSNSVTSEPPLPAHEMTPTIEDQDLPAQPIHEASDDETQPQPAAPARWKRGGGPRKGGRAKAFTPLPGDDNDGTHVTN